MNKLILMLLLLATSATFADEFFVSGDPYKGQPIICSTYSDAAELAELYINKGIEEFSDALSIKTKEALCFSEITVGFVPIKEVSIHKGKETAYVIEVLSGDLFYIVTTRKVIKFTKKSIAV